MSGCDNEVLRRLCGYCKFDACNKWNKVITIPCLNPSPLLLVGSPETFVVPSLIPVPLLAKMQVRLTLTGETVLLSRSRRHNSLYIVLRCTIQAKLSINIHVAISIDVATWLLPLFRKQPGLPEITILKFSLLCFILKY